MRDAHRLIGLVALASLAVLAVWAIATGLARRAPERALGVALAAVGVVLAAQVVAGVATVATGGRPPALHYVYGLAALAAVGLGAGLARALERDRWVVHAVTAVVALAIAFRALATGS